MATINRHPPMTMLTSIVIYITLFLLKPTQSQYFGFGANRTTSRPSLPPIPTKPPLIPRPFTPTTTTVSPSNYVQSFGENNIGTNYVGSSTPISNSASSDINTSNDNLAAYNYLYNPIIPMAIDPQRTKVFLIKTFNNGTETQSDFTSLLNNFEPIDESKSIYMLYPNSELETSASDRISSVNGRNTTTNQTLISNPFSSAPYQSSNDIINSLIQNIFSDLTLQTLPPEELIFGKLNNVNDVNGTPTRTIITEDIFDNFTTLTGSDASGLSDVSDVSRISGVSDLSDLSRVSEISNVPKVSSISDISRVPNVSNLIPDLSDVSHLSGVSSLSGTSGTFNQFSRPNLSNTSFNNGSQTSSTPNIDLLSRFRAQNPPSPRFRTNVDYNGSPFAFNQNAYFDINRVSSSFSDRPLPSTSTLTSPSTASILSPATAARSASGGGYLAGSRLRTSSNRISNSISNRNDIFPTTLPVNFNSANNYQTLSTPLPNDLNAGKQYQYQSIDHLAPAPPKLSTNISLPPNTEYTQKPPRTRYQHLPYPKYITSDFDYLNKNIQIGSTTGRSVSGNTATTVPATGYTSTLNTETLRSIADTSTTTGISTSTLQDLPPYLSTDSDLSSYSSISQRSKIRDHSRSILSRQSSSAYTTPSIPPISRLVTSPLSFSSDISDRLINIISLPTYKFYMGRKN